MDALRGIAFLFVYAYHSVWQSNLQYRDSPFNALGYVLPVAVPIFFVVSGFLLYRPYALARLHSEPIPGVIAYAWRRFLRIVPAYVLVLTAAALIVPYTYVFHDFHFYAFAQIYDPNTVTGGLAQAWTLCVEVTFYALLPLWGLLLRRLRGGVRTEFLALAAMYLIGVAWWVIALRQADPLQTSGPAGVWFMPLPAQLPYFASGMALGVISVIPRPQGLNVRLGRLAPGGWLLAAAAWVIAAYGIGLRGTHNEPMSDLQWIAQHQLFVFIAVGMVLPAVFDGGGMLRRLLAMPWLLWLGLVSYSIYLWHVPVLEILRQEGVSPGKYFPIFVLGGFAISTALSTLSYYIVERPALSLKGRIPDRKAMRGAEAAAASAPAHAPHVVPDAMAIAPEPERT